MHISIQALAIVALAVASQFTLLLVNLPAQSSSKYPTKEGEKLPPSPIENFVEKYEPLRFLVSSWKTYLEHHPTVRELLILLGFFFVFVQLAWVLFTVLSYITPLFFMTFATIISATCILASISLLSPSLFKRLEGVAAGYGLNLDLINLERHQ